VSHPTEIEQRKSFFASVDPWRSQFMFPKRVRRVKHGIDVSELFNEDRTIEIIFAIVYPWQGQDMFVFAKRVR
jgi:hypothetical protein